MAWGMPTVALALFGWFVVAPPQLPPDIGDVPPPNDDAPSEDVETPSEQPDAPREDVEAPPEDVEAPSDTEAPSDAAPSEDEAITITAPDESTDEGDAAAGDAATDAGAAAGSTAVQRPNSTTPVQRPGGAATTPQTPTQPSATPRTTPPARTEGPAAPTTEPASESESEEASKEEPETETYKKLGGFRLFRVGVAAKIGYSHGTSAKNGLYDRDKSIQDSIDNGMVTMSGAGDLGTTKFGGPQFGFILDAEVVGINVWLDFHKFFTPGGLWALLLGYDHEFGFGKRLRLDVGAGVGLHKAFLGSALSDLYYDKDNPAAINIGTLGIEGRGMVDLHIKIVGPLFTGPYAMLGYRHLWSANAAEVTTEKGLHYSFGWTLRLDFAAPKLIGGRKTKQKSP